ncbi:MAG: GtrA family protein [Alphaproteobacteria bacterium]
MSLLARLKKLSFLRFAVIGALGMPVDAGVLWLMLNAGHAPYFVARPVSWFFAATFTWLGNRYFTFRHARARGIFGAAGEWGKFLAANAIGGAFNVGTSIALKNWGPAPLNNPYIALMCGVLVGLVFNFTLSRKVVFRSVGASQSDQFKGPL